MSEIIVASRNLKPHMGTRTAVKSYRCELCPESYMNGITLNRHVMPHTGEKPIKCKNYVRNYLLEVAI